MIEREKLLVELESLSDVYKRQAVANLIDEYGMIDYMSGYGFKKKTT